MMGVEWVNDEKMHLETDFIQEKWQMMGWDNKSEGIKPWFLIIKQQYLHLKYINYSIN